MRNSRINTRKHGWAGRIVAGLTRDERRTLKYAILDCPPPMGVPDGPFAPDCESCQERVGRISVVSRERDDWREQALSLKARLDRAEGGQPTEQKEAD